MLLEDWVYTDAALPFSLHSASDALKWITKYLSIEFLWHYLNSFIIIGHPDTEECAFFLLLLITITSRHPVSDRESLKSSLPGH